MATFDATDHGIMQFLLQWTEKAVQLQISHVNVSKTFCRGLFLKALFEPAANDLVLLMRFRNLEQDLTGILDWRLPEADPYSSKEVYTAVDALGKRLCLSLRKESSGAVSTIEFRRSQECRCRSDWGNAHHGRDNFNNDVDAAGFGVNRGPDWN
ncbi:hypothetical protein AAVH_20304 [Aphelenchoides avenae]|nr:hypothetical protein AAVH_20304 [Aphelenchus avenae]